MSIKLAVVGAGRWGINHVKTGYSLLGENLKLVCDACEAAKQRITQAAPSVSITSRLEDVLGSEEINAVIVATPAETHFEVATRVLKAGKACLVEKPITLATKEARELIQLARQLDQILMVGHVLLYHPAVLEMKKRIQQGLIGKVQYIYSNRLNLGTIRSEENILWSFAPHDIAILQFLVGHRPTAVDAKGASILQSKIEDTTVTHLTYPENIHAHIFVSWLHPFKEQRLVVIGQKGMIVFEDTAAKHKLRFYPKGFDVSESGLKKFEGEYMVIPTSTEQPLVAEHEHFYDCILNHKKPLTDGEHALEVLEILEQAQSKLGSAARNA